MKFLPFVVFASALIFTGHATPSIVTPDNTTAPCGYSPIPFLRAYNAQNSDHFYVTNADEMVRAVATNLGYTYEGNAAQVLSFSEAGSIPLWRLYSYPAGDHFYTTDSTERANAIQQYGYTDEGIAAYVFATAVCSTVPFYRLYNPGIQDHFYTTSAVERDQAISQYGYNDEGIAAYVNPQ